MSAEYTVNLTFYFIFLISNKIYMDKIYLDI